MTTTNTPKVHHRTWYSEHMSGYRRSGTSVPTGTSSGHPTTGQAEIKDKNLREFTGATFAIDLTAQGAPLHADQNDVQKVFDHLRDHRRVTHVTLFGDDNSTEDAPRLPSDGFRAETKSYEPFTHLLNTIVHVANSCLTGPRYLRALRFYPHNAEMGDKLDSDKPLKPDILGLLPSATTGDPKVYWRDVAVFVEVKNYLVDAIKQLATYARNHLTLGRRRSFSIAMYFDHKALTLSFLCFHRSGLSSSLPLPLYQEDGFRSIIKHMVGIMSIRDEEAFGLDMTRVNDVYRLNNCNYDIVRTIQLRESVRGHSTVVYSLKRQPAGAQNYPASLRSRNLMLTDALPHLPEKLIYKLSYQPEGHPSEGALFSGFFGQFGIVDIVGFHISSSEEFFGCTSHHLLNAQFLKFGKKSEVGTPELRYLHCTALGLEGLPLLDISDPVAGIPTPPELVETILHSMIGHYNLFLGGVLHRDISSGNILRLRDPINRTPGYSMSLLGLPTQDVSVCRGFLVDGDQAITWRKGEITPSLERSGTLPFMSIRLLDAWDVGTQALHTAGDDLESFLWVLVWALVYILKWAAEIDNESSIVHHLERVLSSRDLSETLRKERITKKRWTEKVFRDLIQDWLKISENFRTAADRLEETLLSSANDTDTQERVFDELDEHCKVAYKDFIQAGYDRLQNIRRFVHWKDVVAFNGELLHQ